MVRSLSTKIYTTYCFMCEKMTQTLNKKRIEHKGKYKFKGVCEGCKNIKVDTDDLGYYE